MNAAKHLRQYSDSVVDSGTCVDDLCDNLNAATGTGNDGEARDAITRLEPRGPLLTFHRAGAPFRSASFGQADFNQGNRLCYNFISQSSLTGMLELGDCRILGF